MDVVSPFAATLAAPAVTDGPSVFAVVFPLTMLLLIAVAVPTALVVLNKILSAWAVGSRNDMPGKHEPYESGLPGVIGTAGERFSIKFYLVAMLFLVFDIEVAFLYPWAIQFDHGGWGMVGVLAVFLLLLEVGYLYLWRKGALDWDK